jgi:hypothetical protein
MPEQKQIFADRLANWQMQSLQKQIDDVMMIGIKLI